MPEKMSNAAAERELAKKALSNGELKERETYTAKQVASRCGTDSKTMRKFFRSNHSTVEPVGQGGRYEFAARDLPKIKHEFDAWQKKAKARQPAPKETVHIHEVMDQVAHDIKSRAEIEAFAQSALEQEPDDDITLGQLADAIERAQDEEPTPEELAALEEDLDLDDLDEDD